jgi:hypothetical protein
VAPGEGGREGGGGGEGGTSVAWLNPQGKQWTVTNIPIKCFYPGCSEVHWKYNMAAHFLRMHIVDPPVVEGWAVDGMRWRRKSRALKEAVEGLLFLFKAPRVDTVAFAMTDYCKGRVEELLGQIMDVYPKELATELTFCLEEMARESGQALNALKENSGKYHTRERGKEKGKKGAQKGKRGRGGATLAGQAAAGADGGGGGRDEAAGEKDGSAGAQHGTSAAIPAGVSDLQCV